MLDSAREKLRRMPTAVTCTAAILLLAGSAVMIYRNARTEQPPPESRYADLIYRKCSDPGCGHVVSDRRIDLLQKGYMPLDRVEEPLGDGRKCPKCGRLSLRFATRDAKGDIVANPAAAEDAEP
jgi:hypothetical protein